MSIFIHSQNQSLLWNIISNIEITKTIFVEGSPQKAIWFKNIIEEFYIKHYGRNITLDQLRELNKEVIAHMVENLKLIYKNSARPPPVTYSQEPQTIYSRSKNTNHDDQFSKRQREYETMVTKPTPQEPKFSENIKDEPLSNIEELIKEQQKLRDYEMNIHGTPAITIHKEEIVLVTADRQIEETREKKVSWSDESTKQGTIQSDIDLLKSQISDLYSIIQELRQSIELFNKSQ